MIRRFQSIRPVAVAAAMAMLGSALRAGTPPPAPPVLPFIEDDYGKALALAKQKKVPIFVEAWAPW